MNLGLLTAVCVLGGVLAGCGLDGVRGQITAIEADGILIVHDIRGQDVRIHVDERTHQDDVQVGDRVQAFITRKGRAEFVQRLDP